MKMLHIMQRCVLSPRPCHTHPPQASRSAVFDIGKAQRLLVETKYFKRLAPKVTGMGLVSGE